MQRNGSKLKKAQQRQRRLWYTIQVERKNRTIDWQKKETARAQMRKMVKRLLKKYKYPPEDYDFAINTVINQCELWTDNVEPRAEEKLYKYVSETELSMVAETPAPYGEKK